MQLETRITQRLRKRITDELIGTYGKKDPVSRTRQQVARRAGLGLFLYTKLRHWDRPYGKDMTVEIPVGMPGKEKIPSYFLIPFHGLPNGYLSRLAVEQYDRGVSFVFAGKDNEMRRSLTRALSGDPGDILDVGCGTGISTYHLSKRFPSARVTGVDLSPYNVEFAREQAQKRGLPTEFLHAAGEDMPFENASFGTVASTFVFHEVPVAFTKKIVAEMFRVLRPGGEIGITDAAQLVDNPAADRFQGILYEPYFKKYARMSWKAVLEEAGFTDVREWPVYTYGIAMNKVALARKPVAKNRATPARKPQRKAAPRRKAKKAA